jgi:hypothetical protein
MDFKRIISFLLPCLNILYKTKIYFSHNFWLYNTSVEFVYFVV